MTGAAVTSIDLRVNDFNGLLGFYTTQLGMCVQVQNQDRLSFGYTVDACHIVFHKVNVGNYIPGPDNLYWKVGITVRNLRLAVEHLRRAGVTVSEPAQFLDIGYLCHVQDPKGFTIELLQCGFDGNEQPVPQGHAVGAQATLAHLTLRVTDIACARAYCEQTLGMRLMSIQPVSQYGFCLYFYAWSSEVLPDPALTSVDNREWLWSRPYTMIELQHLESPGSIVRCGAIDEAGFAGFRYALPPANEQMESSFQIADAVSNSDDAGAHTD